LTINQYRYYVLDAPTVSDGEYDALMRELTRLETNTRRCARRLADPAGGRHLFHDVHPVAHAERMLSLDNAFSDEGAGRLGGPRRAGRRRPFSYLCELKVDGWPST